MSTRIADGHYTLPTGPGFGIELDWDYVRAHTVTTRSTDRSSLA
jgi:L-alanine-DL-glutamate epimerase-like enolase superfamily enzyme